VSEYGTPFAETELLAVANENTSEAERILRDMYPGELDTLIRDARELAEMAQAMASIKRREEAA